MKPISFKQANHVWAKDQKPYLPLPAFVSDKESISCYRLSFYERLRVLIVGRMWLRQLNFGQPLQPQSPTVISPFLDI